MQSDGAMDILSLNWSRKITTKKLNIIKTFGADKTDVFYNHLNEIELNLALLDEDDDDELGLCDPRNGELVTKIVLDHSETGKLQQNQLEPKKNRSFNKKNRNRKTFKQIGKLPGLNKNCKKRSLKDNRKTLERHTNSDYLLKENDGSEKSDFNESLKSLIATQPVNKPKLHMTLMKYYNQTIQAEKKRISIGEQYYSIQSAIPIKSNDESISHILGDIIYQNGFITEYVPDFRFSKTLNSTYNFIPIERLENITVSCLNDIEIDVVIPEETIHMLLSPSSAYENWDVLFKVTPSSNKTGKLVSFEIPFPLHSDSKFVCAQMFDKVVHFEMRYDNDSYLSLFDGKINKRSVNSSRQTTNRCSSYHLEKHDKYMSKYLTMERLNKKFNSGYICRKWAIKKTEQYGEKNNTNLIELATNITAPYYFQEDGALSLVNLSFKLEYKSEYGVESMIKSELINEWLRQLFTSIGYTKRFRIDVNSLKVVAIQDLSLEDIEAELFRLYNINPTQLIGSLYSILMRIHDFPHGEYMLHFSQKFCDKFLVSSKTSTLLEGGIKLSEMCKHVETTANLLEAADYNPIDIKTSQRI